MAGKPNKPTKSDLVLQQVDAKIAEVGQAEAADPRIGRTTPRLKRAYELNRQIERLERLEQQAKRSNDMPTLRKVQARLDTNQSSLGQIRRQVQENVRPTIARPQRSADPDPAAQTSTSPQDPTSPSVPASSTPSVPESPSMPGTPVFTPPSPVSPASESSMQNVNVSGQIAPGAQAQGKLVHIPLIASSTSKFVGIAQIGATGTAASGVRDSASVVFASNGLSYARLKLRGFTILVTARGNFDALPTFRLTTAKSEGDLESIYGAQLGAVKMDAVALVGSTAVEASAAFGAGSLYVPALRQQNVVERTSQIDATIVVEQPFPTAAANSVKLAVQVSALCDVLDDPAASGYNY